MPRRDPKFGWSRARKPAWAVALLSLLAASLCGQNHASRDPQNLEYAVKAAFLLNFTKFIEWPPRVKAAPESPFAICVLGDDPFGPVLDQTLRGERVEGRRLEARRITRESTDSCSIVYVSKSEKGVADFLKTAGPDVLTVGEGESFLHDGGMIAFVIENHHVRFSIRLAATQNSALKFSSRLLSVARLVEN